MSPGALISPDDALAAVLAHIPAPRAVPCRLDEASGLVLAEPVRFDRDYPPFNRAMMDGFGVCTEDAGGTVRVVGEVPAGTPWEGTIAPGAAVEIMTGAPCPAGVQAVVPVETVTRNGGAVSLPAPLEPGANIAPKGSEGRAGDELVPGGTFITPLVIAALASVGAHMPAVYARPRIAMITTGDELAAPGDAPAWYQIRDSNGPLLHAMLHAMGAASVHPHHAHDTESSLQAAFAAAADADIIVLTGGVSAGRRDLVPACCRQEGFQVHFHKVAQKPGKPLLFATRNDQLLFGLPGNPLAVHLCAHRYVAPAIRAMSGRPPVPGAGHGTLTEAVSVKGDRTWFCFARVATASGGLEVTPMRNVSSADVFSIPAAHAILRVEPGAALAAGERVAFEWLYGGAHP